LKRWPLRRIVARPEATTCEVKPLRAAEPASLKHDASFRRRDRCADKAALAAESLAERAQQLRSLEIEPGSAPSTSRIREVRQTINARRLREQLFQVHLFEDPGWDLLLELYAVYLEQHRICARDLYARSGVRPSTGVRWIAILEKYGFVIRQDDPLDARRRFVSLTPETSLIMRRYFDRIGSIGT
jgi:DNA-binding MarR family transcriptional regulator